jgi:hypothetical protein
VARLPDSPGFITYMRHWQPGHWAIGADERGLMAAGIKSDPHLIISGTTGSGKTYLLRAVIASALASGLQVIVISLLRPGLRLFEAHSNFRFVAVEPNHPEQAVAYMRAAYSEITRRNRRMYECSAEDWETLASTSDPRTLLVFDEMANLAEDAIAGGMTRDEFWRPARLVAREGRKAGMHLAVALQDPNQQYVDLSLRRNALPIALKLRDQSISRAALGVGGAEELQPRQFLTTLGNLRRGVTLSAEDAPITGWLAHQPVKLLSEPEWLYEQQAPAAPTATTQPLPEDKAETIRALAAEGLGRNEIQRRVFGYVGGKAHAAVAAALSEQV